MERRYCYRVGYYILKIFIKIRILLYEFPCKIVYKYLKVLSNSLRIYQ